MDAEERDCVVVVFGMGPADGWCKLSHCPMSAHGPYTRAEARKVADSLADWMQPHILALDEVSAASLRSG